MHPKVIEHLTRVADLVDAGELPVGAISRLAYMGHRMVNSYDNFGSRAEFKCVACKATGNGDGIGDSEPWGCGCPEPEVYKTNRRRDAKWSCTTCSHEWVGEEGRVCPECQMIAPATWVKVLWSSGRSGRGFLSGPSKEHPTYMEVMLDPNGQGTAWEDMMDVPPEQFPNDWFDGKRITLWDS